MSGGITGNVRTVDEAQGGTGLARALQPRLGAYLQFRHEVSSSQLTKRDGKLSLVVSALFLFATSVGYCVCFVCLELENKTIQNSNDFHTVQFHLERAFCSAKADGIPY